MYDIILRNCGSAGWLGILIDLAKNEELYRTGKHCQSPLEAFDKVRDWRAMHDA